MSEPHKDRSICVHWQIHYVKIIQMMAWEYFILPLGTMYETYFLNCSLPYFTEFVVINNIICKWHTSGNGSTACSLLMIMTAFAKTMQRQANDQLKKSVFKLQVLYHLHPFMHSQRDIQAPMNFSLVPTQRGSPHKVPGCGERTKGRSCGVSWTQMAERTCLWGVPWLTLTLLYVVLVCSSDSQKYLVY